MVVEYLTFAVEPDALAEWLAAEETHWSRFLERQPGFVRKQMWRSADDPTQIHAVIWWETLEQWKSVPEHELAAVAAAMGPLEREPTCQTFEVIRDC